MKIESFDLDLSSRRSHTESYSRKFSQEFSFDSIMDRRMVREEGETYRTTETHGPSTSETLRETEIHGRSPGDADAPKTGFAMIRSMEWWSASASLTADASRSVTPVSLSSQFQEELQKMREIMSSVLETLEKMMVDDFEFQLTGVDDVFAVPVSRGSFGVSQMFAWEYEYTETVSYTYEETENTQVSAGGVIQTADNREIDFTFDFEMSRSFFREDSVSWTESGYVLMDPLVIRTDMDAPLLSGGRFSFDLDLDGELDDLPVPGPGTGFLALDLNGDGIINDGSELFGPATGHGFDELAEWDMDGNEWIDENDEVFDRLTVWQSDGDGGMTLTRLKDTGVGAIYLAGVESSFDLMSEENELLARVNRTSIAVTEEGGVLPVQELNYTV